MKWNSLIVMTYSNIFSATSLKDTVAFSLENLVFTFLNVKCSGNTAWLHAT